MASLSDYLETALVEHVLLADPFTAPATVYLALFTSATTDAGGGSEVTGGSYARQAVAFTAGTAGTAASSAAETFPSMPACVVTHAALFDASTGGAMLMHAPLVSAKTLTAGQPLVFETGDITATFA